MSFSKEWIWKALVLCILPGLNPELSGIRAQSDTTLYLQAVEVTAQRINLSDVGKHTDVIDSQSLVSRQYNSLATLLGIQTPLYIRSYGAGTLATLGIRGGNATHTQVMWNGIPIRNPMLGLIDLGLMPMAFTDRVAVHYGGHGAAFGSGAVGGLISLGTQPLTDQMQIQLHAGAGSWGTWIGDGSVTYGWKKLRFNTRVFYQAAENNYRFKINKDLPEQNQVHNMYLNAGALQEVEWRLNEIEMVTGRIWYQYADRQIPPTSTQSTSKAAQQDESYRASLHWSRNGESIRWECKAAWLDETIDYQDSLIALYTHNTFSTYLGEVNAAFRIGQSVNVAGGVYAEWVSATSANYDGHSYRNQQAAFISIATTHEHWLWRLQMREEVTDQKWSPLLLDLSTEWTGISHLRFKTSISRNYRVPTLNDLYWQPGGNPDLVPEEGWTAEVGAVYTNQSDVLEVNASLTGYGRIIDQWIMWMPPIKDVRNYWSPINVTKVNSRGLETRAGVDWKTGSWRVGVNAGLDLTWSTFGEALPEFSIEDGDQLFYIPVENLQTGLRLGTHCWDIQYFHHWFGSSPGINEDVDAGNVGTLNFNYNFTRGKSGWLLYLQADNVWNVPYRLIERRPMPGRSITVGVRVNLS